MENLRHLERFDLQLPANIETISEERKKATETMTLKTRNINSRGAYFRTRRPLMEGTDVKIAIDLLTEKLKKLSRRHALIKVNGKVIRKDPSGMAICFKEDFLIESV
jgi:hypothetical protein